MPHVPSYDSPASMPIEGDGKRVGAAVDGHPAIAPVIRNTYSTNETICASTQVTSGRAPAALTAVRIFAICALMNVANSCGVVPIGSAPRLDNRS